MIAVVDGEPPARHAIDPFESLQPINISELSPTHPQDDLRYLEAEIVLVWPYSSSSRSLSLLLASRNIRARKSKGQVKVTFGGGCAGDIALTRLGIGDVVKLSLQHAEWVHTGDEVSTPGKKIEWDLRFSTSVTLRASRGETLLGEVVFVGREESETRQSEEQPRNTGPVVNGHTEAIRRLEKLELSSPAFSHSNRRSGGTFIDASLDPFADDDGFILGKGRKRTKFARSSGSWRLAEDSSDSQDEVQVASRLTTEVVDSIVISDAEASTSPTPSEPVTPTRRPITSPARREDLTIQMPPPPLLTPRRPFVDTSKEGVVAEQSPDTETTPRLLPVASPSLPMVYPLVKRSGASVGFFGQPDGMTSELDASAVIKDGSHKERPPKDTQPEYISLITPDEETFGSDVMPQFGQHDEDSIQDIPMNEDRAAIDVTAPQESFFTDSSNEQPDPLQFHDHADQDSERVDLLQVPRSVTAEDEDMYRSARLIPELGALQPYVNDRELQEISEANPRLQDVTIVEAPETIQINEVEITSSFGLDMDMVVEDKSSEVLIDVSQHTQTLSPAFVDTLDGGRDLIAHNPERDHNLLTHSDLSSAVQLQNRTQLDGTVVDLEEQSLRGPEGESHPSTESRDHLISPDGIGVEDEVRNQSIVLPPSPVATQDEMQLPDRDTQEATVAIQLPRTPDQTQEKDRSREMAAVAASSPEQPHLHEEVVTEDQPLALETPAIKTTKRSRQSLSLQHISQTSSPYFTPRRSARMHSSPQPSSPRRKENLPPVTSPQIPAPSKKPVSPLPPRTNGVVKEKTRRLSGLAENYGLTTPSSYYPPLATVDEFFAANIDVLAICTVDVKEPQRAKTGAKDYHCTYQIVDPSLASREEVVAQIFRPYKTALPRASRGSVVLFRNMKVQSQKRKCMLLSTESSSWAVFSHPEHTYTKASMLGVTITGPPIEYGPSERLGAIDLMQWWDGEGAMQHCLLKDSHQKSTNGTSAIESQENLEMSPARSTTKVAPTPLRRSTRRGNRTDNHGNAGDPNPDMVEIRAQSSSDVSPVSQKLSAVDGSESRRSPSVIHELRDGTKYVDENPEDRKRRGTRGESLIHELRDGTSYIDE